MKRTDSAYFLELVVHVVLPASFGRVSDAAWSVFSGDSMPMYADGTAEVGPESVLRAYYYFNAPFYILQGNDGEMHPVVLRSYLEICSGDKNSFDDSWQYLNCGVLN